MKVGLIFLAYGRPEMTERVFKHNSANAGHDFTIHIMNIKGIAKAINAGIDEAKGSDAFMFMANDILEPDNWLKLRVDAIEPDSGMIAIPHHMIFSERTYCDVVGNTLFPKAVVDKIGYFNEELGDYAANDNDYNRRCQVSGFKCFYLPNVQAEHIYDPNNDTLYGYSKLNEVERIWGQHERDSSNYITGQKDCFIKRPE